MNKENAGFLSRPLKWFYSIVVFALVFSGFGQMPIFKRYYLADLPGMAWSADFHITLMIHYAAAALLLGLTAYLTVTWFLARSGRPRIDRPARLRVFLFTFMIATGIVLVLRNLPGFVLPPRLIMAATFIHIGGSMLYVLAALTYFRLAKARK